MHRNTIIEQLSEKAYPQGYNYKKCHEILEKTKNIHLPKFTKQEIEKYRNDLENINKKYDLKDKENKDKFLMIAESLNYIYAVNDDPEDDQEKLDKIKKWLTEYEYIIKQFTTENNLHKQTMEILKNPIETFIGKYIALIDAEKTTKVADITIEYEGG